MGVRFPLARLFIERNTFRQYLLKKNNDRGHEFLFYKLALMSLVSPFRISGLREAMGGANDPKSKMLIKQSYLILTWFYYMASSEVTRRSPLKFFILPASRPVFTLTRAPMAHRNWSKEQYRFQLFKFVITIKSTLDSRDLVRSVNAGLLFVLLNKTKFPSFETNLIFIRTAVVLFFIHDATFFNLYRYCRPAR